MADGEQSERGTENNLCARKCGGATPGLESGTKRSGVELRVSGYLESMLSQLRQRYPDGQIACTRKAIPGTRSLATQAILAAGGIIHRGGCAETVLLFANHRRFLTNPNDWTNAVARLRSHAPEKDRRRGGYAR